ncbi:monovalent cation/H+ antiporter complex subunit F [Dolosigranulum savutiense]|uniref:Monovalent cation/H+ antiporter complex subunit F n=1 Tax=Dolosigranulum savutiense TaxID=3110288 RepID=A0AB74TQJ7_9LACT
MMTFDWFVLTALIILSIGSIYRVIVGPTVWDRILGFSFFSAKIIMLGVVFGVLIDRVFVVDISMIYGILDFIGTIMIVRFIEAKGDI